MIALGLPFFLQYICKMEPIFDVGDVPFPVEDHDWIIGKLNQHLNYQESGVR